LSSEDIFFFDFFFRRFGDLDIEGEWEMELESDMYLVFFRGFRTDLNFRRFLKRDLEVDLDMEEEFEVLFFWFDFCFSSVVALVTR